MTDEDRRRLALIGDLIREGERLDRANLQWLYDQVRELSTYRRPDEFQFPEFAVFIRSDQPKGFALKFLARLDCRKELTILPGSLSGDGVKASLENLVCPIHDSIMVARPWIQAHQDTSREALAQLTRCHFSLHLDGSCVIRNAPMKEGLIGPSGELYRSAYPTIRVPGGAATVFNVGKLDPVTHEATLASEYGCFVANCSSVRFEIGLPEDSAVEFRAGPKEWSPRLQNCPRAPLQVTVGLTAAQYTTRAYPTL